MDCMMAPGVLDLLAYPNEYIQPQLNQVGNMLGCRVG